MKISKIVFKKPSEVDKMPRFDLASMPRRQTRFLTPLTWVLSLPDLIKYGAKITKHNMEGLKPPYMLLCNHNCFFDFNVATKAIFPHRANYVVAVDGFINREGIMRAVGCFGKRKFVHDIGLFKKIKHTLFKNRTILIIYPEARYSLTGINEDIPVSLGKMLKLLKVPVVTLITHGHHLVQPNWNITQKRKLKTTADMTQILTPEDLEKLSVDEINHAVNKAFEYDDYTWQVENNVHITLKNRAEGLHKILYKCPSCKEEAKMSTKENTIFCEACGKHYEMDTLGRLKASNDITEFPHIPDWYRWEREEVNKEVEAGTYHIEKEVDVDTLPNSKGFYRFGKANLVHNMDGFTITAKWGDEDFLLRKTPLENTSTHIEFEYWGKGDAIDLSTSNDSYWLFSKDKDYLVTKIHFAVEALYRKALRESKASE